MTSHDQAADPVPPGGNAKGRRPDADPDSSEAVPAGLAEGFRQLSLSGPSPDAMRRLEARFAQVVEAGDPGPLARVAAWFGFGTAGPRLSPRMAAGALLVLALGGGASTAAGVSPLQVVSRVGELTRSVVANLDPTSGQGAAPAPRQTATGTAEASPSPAPSESASAGKLAETVTAQPKDSPTPGATATAPATSAAGQTTAGPSTSSSTAEPGTPASADRGTPAPTETPEPTVGAEPSGTPEPSGTAGPETRTPTETGTPGTPEPTPTPSPTAVPSPETRTYEAGSAGSVELRIDNGDLLVISVRPDRGWTANIESQSAEDVEITFRRNEEEVHFNATVADGAIDVSITTSGQGSGEGGGSS